MSQSNYFSVISIYFELPTHQIIKFTMDASSSSHMGKVLTEKYISIQPPILSSSAPRVVEKFQKEYIKYEEARKRDGLPVASILECVDPDLLEVLRVRDESSVQDDESFKRFLESKQVYETTLDVLKALETNVMDLRIADIDERIDLYDIKFHGIMRRAKVTNITLKESVLCKAYVDNLRPTSIKEMLLPELKCEDVTLTDVMAKACDALKYDHQVFMMRRSEDSHNEKKSGHTPVLKSEMAGKGPDKEWKRGGNLRDKPQMCRACGVVPWSPQHWQECKKRNNHGSYQRQTQGTPTMSNHGSYQRQTQGTPATSATRPPPGFSQDKEVRMIDVPLTCNMNCAKPVKKNEFMIPVVFGQSRLMAHIDTGAGISCISTAALGKVQDSCRVTQLPQMQKLALADGTQSEARTLMLDTAIVSPITQKTVIFPWVYAELKSDKELVLLGRDMLDELGLSMAMMAKEKCIVAKSTTDEGDDVTEAEDELFMIEADSVPCAAPAAEGISSIQVDVTNPLAKEIWKEVQAAQDVFDGKVCAEGAAFVPFEIELKDENRVILIPERVLAPSMRVAVEKNLDSLQSEEILETAGGPHASPVVVVPKKNGEVRVCGDYRVLNENTVDLQGELPRITEMLKAAEGAKVFGVVDALHAFNQAPLARSAKKWTAIRTAGRWLQYTKLPYGLKNGPKYFQREMSRAFADLIGKIMVIYLDDILIFAKTPEEFVVNLRTVLDRCRQVRLKLKPEKCRLGFNKIECVGYVISDEGRSISPERVKAIRDLPRPNTVSELRCFLGQVNYFRDFIDKCSELTVPLTEMLKKDGSINWTERRIAAFEALKSSLTSHMMLAHGEDGQLVLKTDASGVGIGGCLVARDAEGKDRPVCYMSKTLSQVERRWSTIELETYAVVWCLTYEPIHHLTQSHHVLIEVDHRNIVWLNVAARNNDKLNRWLNVLQGYDYSIHHVKGSTNTVADALSRMNHELEVNAVERVSISEMLLQAQDKYIASKPEKAKKDDKSGFYVIDDRVWVPSEASDLKNELIKSVHNATMGHFGVEKTVNKLQDAKFTWYHMIPDVKEFVDTCPICQKVRARKAVEVHMGTTKVDTAWHTVVVDSLGPFPESPDGFVYLEVCTDAFTRFVELVPTKTEKADETADGYVSAVYSRHGLPAEIRSDNGPQYVNKLIDALLEKLKIRHHKVLPYHPQGNGIAERVNQEVLRHLRCLVIGFKEYVDWPKLIPIVQHILNNTVHSATNATPRAMLYGDLLGIAEDFSEVLEDKELSEAADNNSEVLEETDGKTAAEKYLNQLKTRIAVVRKIAGIVQQKVVDERVDEGNPSYKAGDFVLLVPVERKSKLHAKYLGPFKVLDVYKDKACRIKSLVYPTQISNVPIDRLRKFDVPDLPTDTDLTSNQLTAIAASDAGEFVVEQILDHVGSKRKDIHFLIRWAGYSEEDDTWEPFDNVNGCVVLNAYLDAHPELRRSLRMH